MANIQEAFPSNYIRASDLRGGQPIVTIDHVAFELVGRDKQNKAVLYFRGKEKGLVLNKTNAMKITELTGTSETDDWSGFAIRLFATEVQYGSETMEGIRVKAAPPAGAGTTRQAAPPPPPPQADDFPPDDEIPF